MGICVPSTHPITCGMSNLSSNFRVADLISSMVLEKLTKVKLIHHASVLPGYTQHSRFTLFKSLLDKVAL